MRTLLRWVTTRYGLVGLIVVVVTVTVGIARFAGGETSRAGSAAGGTDRHAGASAGAGPDDGVYRPSPVPDMTSSHTGEPRLPRGVADPRPTAEAFAARWVDSGASATRWHDRLSRHATPRLMDRLDGTDPGSVPTNRISGDARLVRVTGTSHAEVSLEADNGVLLLGLVAIDRHWKVDTIDWRRR